MIEESLVIKKHYYRIECHTGKKVIHSTAAVEITKYTDGEERFFAEIYQPVYPEDWDTIREELYEIEGMFGVELRWMIQIPNLDKKSEYDEEEFLVEAESIFGGTDAGSLPFA